MVQLLARPARLLRCIAWNSRHGRDLPDRHAVTKPGPSRGQDERGERDARSAIAHPTDLEQPFDERARLASDDVDRVASAHATRLFAARRRSCASTWASASAAPTTRARRT